MAKTPVTKQRLLFLQNLLLERTDQEHPLTMGSILSVMQKEGIPAERKSIYDDLRALQESGMDIRMSGRPRGYYVAERLFATPELKLMMDAVQSSRSIPPQQSRELLKKLENMAGQHEAGSLKRQVVISSRVKAANQSVYDTIEKIHEAITAGKQVSFRYLQWELDFSSREKVKEIARRGGKRYHVSPWSLLWNSENYYLVGYDSESGSIRHYRIDRMSELRIVKKTRQGQELFRNFDAGKYSKRMFGMFGGQEKTVRIRFANRLIGPVIDRFGKDIFLTPGGDGHFEATVPVEVSPQFFSWLFGFGTEAKIVAPREVADEFAELAKKIIDFYKS